MSSETRLILIMGFATLLFTMASLAVFAVGGGWLTPANFWNAVSAAVAIAILLVILGLGAAVIWALANGTINLRYLLAEPANPAAQQRAETIAAGQMAGESSEPGDRQSAAATPPEIPKASMSRFQLLIFTFVIAGLYLALCLENGRLIDIPENVLLLLGLSSGTYAASKGIKAVSDRKSEAAATPEEAT
jgi:hypothetical protein